MQSFTTYLNFDGNTREAMTFYAMCFGAELSISSFRERGIDAPPGAEDRIIHARLAKGAAVIMASDTMPGMPYVRGNNFFVSIGCESADEVEQLFKAFSDGGTALMPPQETFWAPRFAMLTDKFGVGWMLNYQRV